MDKLSGLHGAIRGLAEPMVVMRRVVEQALALIPVAEGSVIELADDEQLTYVCAAGSLISHVGTRLHLDQSLSGMAVRTGRTLRCDDASVDDRVDAAACRRVGAVSMICVPLRRGSEPVGVLKVCAAQANVFDDSHVLTMTRLADFVTWIIAAVTDFARLTTVMVEANDEQLALRTTARSGRSGSGRRSQAEVDGVAAFIGNVLMPGMVGDVESRARVRATLEKSAFSIVCQPVIHLASGRLSGAEALSRFRGPPSKPPDAWFAEAHRVGLGVDLELAAVRAALRVLPHLPEGTYLAVNAGPETAMHPDLLAMLAAVDGGRIVLELTEHHQVDDYHGLTRTLGLLRDQGVRVAVDDTGSGFSSFAHILSIAPDIIKLDRILTMGIDMDPVRRALAGALVTFADETGALVIAEGIETGDELDTLRRLGIGYGQGFFLGRPAATAPQTATSDQAGWSRR